MFSWEYWQFRILYINMNLVVDAFLNTSTSPCHKYIADNAITNCVTLCPLKKKNLDGTR